MPNHWMDQIVILCDKYHDDHLCDKYHDDHTKLINEITKVMIDYKTEFKKYDEAITDQMVEMEGYE